eukprot:evm.model.scf_60.1 EVM.evm.TU.scf_60.1   scf_60:8726-10934(+)
MFEPMVQWAAKRYQAAVAAELKKYGLRYDDLYDPMHDLDINEAISRLPQDVQMERNMRLKRAMDLSLKHVYLDKEMQEKQTPFNHYLQGTLEEVKNEQMERYMVGAERTYDRSLP